MGRRPNEPDAWRIVIDTKTSEVFAYHPSARPTFTSRQARSQYDEIGRLHSQKDAEEFCQYKEIGIKPDAVAFLNCEHILMRIRATGRQADIEELRRLAKGVQDETGRTCFGHCKSLEGAPACATCFASRNQTWSLCACIKCILSEDDISACPSKTAKKRGRPQKKQVD